MTGFARPRQHDNDVPLSAAERREILDDPDRLMRWIRADKTGSALAEMWAYAIEYKARAAVDILLPWVHDPLWYATPWVHDASHEDFRHLLETSRKVTQPSSFEQLLVLAIKDQHPACIQALLDHLPRHVDLQRALRMTVEPRDSTTLAGLLRHLPSGTLPQAAFQEAVRAGWEDGVRLLLPYAKPALNGSEALLTAAMAGDRNLIALLWPHSAPRAAFLHAMHNNRWSAFEHLCPGVDEKTWGRGVRAAPGHLRPNLVACREAYLLRQTLPEIPAARARIRI